MKDGVISYKDIADCEIIDGEYQLQALRIYVAIENFCAGCGQHKSRNC